MGEAHAWLHAHAPRQTVLRPSWIMQNLMAQHLTSTSLATFLGSQRDTLRVIEDFGRSLSLPSHHQGGKR